MRPSLAMALFLASGVAGLVYQVVWVRSFSRVFGTTLASASLVTAVFMLGLGVGSVVAGRAIDRRERDRRESLRAYGVAEVFVGVWGALLAVAIPRLESVGVLFDYAQGADGWATLSLGARLVTYGIAVLAIAPPCLAMGATLTLLVRHVVGADVTASGWRIGLLYGANTLGAAIGALLTDFALVPHLGVHFTQAIAVGLNLAAGATAIAVARRAGSVPVPAADIVKAKPDPLLRWVGGTLLLSGFAAMGLELVWFRYLSQLLGSLRSVFSLVLAVMLVAMWLGSSLGGWLDRHWGRPHIWLMGAQAVLVLSAALLLGGIDHVAAHRAHLDAIRADYVAGEGRSWLELGALLRPIAMVTALPALAMGTVYPLANACVQRARGEVGRRAGWLYLAMTLGNVAGSLATGFVLVPALGVQRAATWLLGVAGLAIVPAYLARRRAHVPYLAAAALVFAGLAWFAQLPAQRLLAPSIPSDGGGTRRLISVSEGPLETIAVTEVVGLKRTLFTNGHSMSSTSAPSQRYMRAFAHIPLLSMEAPRRALVICFGVGNTAHAVSLHPSIEAIDVADLSRNVLSHARRFGATNGDVLDDPRVSVFVNDGRLHLRMVEEERYDLITLEPPPIMFAGVASLYARELYALARSRLRRGGSLTQWLPAYQVEEVAVRSLVRAFVDVFPEAVLLSGADKELILWGMRGDELTVDPDALARRLEERPAVAEDLQRIRMGNVREIAGSFVASADTMRAVTRGVPPVTDAHPIVEHSQLSGIRATRLPANLFDPSQVERWCPRCLERVDGLADYLHVRSLVYQSPPFLHAGAFHRDLAPWTLPDDPRVERAVARSAYLQALFGGPAYTSVQVGREHLLAGRVGAAVSVLLHGVVVAPNDPDAHFALARALRAKGDRAGSELHLAVTLRLRPDHPAANAVVCKRAADAGRLEEARARCRDAIRGKVPISPALRARVGLEGKP